MAYPSEKQLNEHLLFTLLLKKLSYLITDDASNRYWLMETTVF